MEADESQNQQVRHQATGSCLKNWRSDDDRTGWRIQSKQALPEHPSATIIWMAKTVTNCTTFTEKWGQEGHSEESTPTSVPGVYFIVNTAINKTINKTMGFECGQGRRNSGSFMFQDVLGTHFSLLLNSILLFCESGIWKQHGGMVQAQDQFMRLQSRHHPEQQSCESLIGTRGSLPRWHQHGWQLDPDWHGWQIRLMEGILSFSPRGYFL
ncbi:uncharacterized protein ACIGJ3_004541 isoform 1-T1 [Trichechus inunguis]